jgi:hypothetical protein
MNIKALARRVDVGLLLTVVLTVVVVAALLVHYGLPLWLLPLGAGPAGSFGLASWLVHRHATTFAAGQRATDAAGLFNAEQAVTRTVVHSGARR